MPTPRLPNAPPYWYGKPQGFGLPYHGKLESNQVTLTVNGAVLPYDASAGNGSNTLLGLNPRAVAFSTPDDVANGWVWKNRVLLSGAIDYPGTSFIYQAPSGLCWILEFVPQIVGATWSAKVWNRGRFGLFDYTDGCPVKDIDLGDTPTLDFGSFETAFGFTGVDSSAVISQDPTGSNVLIGLAPATITPNSYNILRPLAAVVQLTVSGEIDCLTGLGATVSAFTWKDPSDCIPVIQESSTNSGNVQYGRLRSFNQTCSGADTCLDGTITRTNTQSDAPISRTTGLTPGLSATPLVQNDVLADSAINAYFDEDGLAHFVIDSIDIDNRRTQNVTWTPYFDQTTTTTHVPDGGDCFNGTATQVFHQETQTTFIIRQVDALTEKRDIVDNGAVVKASIASTNKTQDSSWLVPLDIQDSSGAAQYQQLCSDSSSSQEVWDSPQTLTSDLISDTGSLIVDGVTVKSGASSIFPSPGFSINTPRPDRITNRLTGYFMASVVSVNNSQYWIGPATDRADISGWANRYVSYDPYTVAVGQSPNAQINYV